MKKPKPKPCDKCPWVKGNPLHAELNDELRDAAVRGLWFCCHVHMGQCHGAALYTKRMQKKGTERV